MSSDSSKLEKKSAKGPSAEEIYAGFQQMRITQRGLATKLSELETDLNEHKMVIETLKNADENRKCFRMIGGVLVEKQVKDVVPTLATNKEKLSDLIQKVNEQLVKKGQELNEYREKYNIRVQGQDDAKRQEEGKEANKASRGNVLVS